MAGDVLLMLDRVYGGYGELTVLKGVDLVVTSGTLTAVIGANGAGKSTLLKAIFGLVEVTGGTIEYAGSPLRGLNPRDRLARGIVFVPQGRCNFPLMTVVENLEMGAYTRRDNRVRRDIEALLAAYEMLGERRSQHAGNLSGGEQQLLEMAMSMMLHPRLILVDEPSLGLSQGMQQRVFDSILGLRESGAAVVMVEQNAVQALRVADRAIVMELGKVRFEGSGLELLERPEVRRAYLGLGV